MTNSRASVRTNTSVEDLVKILQEEKASKGNGYQIKDEKGEARGIGLLHRMNPVTSFSQKMFKRGFGLVFIFVK